MTIWPSSGDCGWCITTGRWGRELFEKYRRRYSPYGSVASLYLWAVAGGAVPELRDYAPQGKKGAK